MGTIARPSFGAAVELIEVPYDRAEREMVMAASGQRRVPVLVDGETVVVDSRQIVRYLYATHGDRSFARSIAELDADIAADGEPAPPEACDLPSAQE